MKEVLQSEGGAALQEDYAGAKRMRTILCILATAVAVEAFAVNPITGEGTFLSDPAGRVGPDGRLRIFCSRDESPSHYCSPANDMLETADLLSWKLHRDIFRTANPLPSEAMLYAPDAIFHDGKWRLFYCTSTWHAEGIASSDRAEGPYVAARQLGECAQIDPSVFRDDDGTLYYFWGQFSLKGAVLKPDLSGFDESGIREGIIDERRHHFHEGVQLFKRRGIYYLAYADISRNHGGDKCRPTCIGYATANRPFGPYTYRGVVVDNFGCDPQSWNNHGSIVEFGGKWYVFYHRTTNGSVSRRKACVEPIEFDEDGLIREVEMTTSGIGAPLNPFARTEARLACQLTGNVRIVTLPDGQERLDEIQPGDTAIWRYFDFDREAASLEVECYPKDGGRLVVSDAKGMTMATLDVPSGNGRELVRVTAPVVGGFASKRPSKAAVRIAFEGTGGRRFGSLEAFSFRPRD